MMRPISLQVIVDIGHLEGLAMWQARRMRARPDRPIVFAMTDASQKNPFVLTLTIRSSKEG
jgi:hypothetical protein